VATFRKYSQRNYFQKSPVVIDCKQLNNCAIWLRAKAGLTALTGKQNLQNKGVHNGII